MKIPFDPVRFDIQAFNQFINDNGVELYHFKAIECPIGYSDISDARNSHALNHHDCENGYIYKLAGVVKATFTNNSATATITDAGLLDGSVVQCTFPQTYLDQPNKQVYIQLYDRFYIKDCAVLVPNTQKVQADITGLDRLTYRVKHVEFVVDNSGKWYGPEDYTVLENGSLKWITSNRPMYNAELNKGAVYSIRYLYTPFFYASRLIHEVRIANQNDFMTGKATPNRVPYAALLSREYLAQKSEQDFINPDKNNDNRTIPAPASGSFGSR